MKLRTLSMLSLIVISTAAVQAQQLPQLPGPEKEHQWLHQFVGEWSTKSKADMGPGQLPMECEGSISSRMIGGLWVLNEMKRDMAYEGTVDATGKILTLEAQGPNFMAGGKLTKFQDIYEFKSSDEIAISSTVLGEDGKWITFMTGTAKRQNKNR